MAASSVWLALAAKVVIAEIHVQRRYRSRAVAPRRAISVTARRITPGRGVPTFGMAVG